MPATFARILLILIASALSAVPVMAQESDGVAGANKKNRDSLRTVKLLDLADQTRSSERSFYGRVVARDTVDLSFEVGGRLVKFPVREGALLDRSTLVAQLDLEPFKRAVRRARLNLAQAGRALERSETLAADNAVSRADSEDAGTVRELAAVELEQAQENLADATLKAPYDALVASRLTANFTNVRAGTPVVRLHDMSQTHVQIDVPEQLVQRYPDPTAISFFASAGKRFTDVPVKLVEYQTQTASIGQSYRAELLLPAREAPRLLPGASVTVTARLDTDQQGRRVPASAVIADPAGRFQILVFDPSEDDEDVGVVRRRAVEVESPSGDMLVITDLPEDVIVVATGAHLLEDGEEVRRYRGITFGDER